jgi:hypothetical protein
LKEVVFLEKRNSILEICGGRLVEEINYQTGRVAENMLDLCTDAKGARKLKIELIFCQDDTRQVVTVTSKVSTNLAISTPLVTNMTFAVDGDGCILAAELVGNAGQADIFGGAVPAGAVIDLGAVVALREVGELKGLVGDEQEE